MTLKAKLDQLAEVLLDESLSPDKTQGDQRVDIFKSVAAYYLGETKLSAKMPTDGEETMDGFKRRMAAADSTQGNA